MTRTHSFPQIPFTPSTADMIKSRWQELTPQGSTFFEKYLRSLCVETNHIEGTFLLAQQCTQDLMHCGIAEATISYLPQSKIKDPKMIKNILNDTLAAYHKMRPFVQDPEGLSLEVLCEIHLSLMKTCQYSKEGAYIPGGKTRQETRKTVIVRGGTSGDIQCCPFEQVDAEIKYICQMAKDGNGRLARLIASIPLIKAGYPPMSISVTHRQQFFQAINMVSGMGVQNFLRLISKCYKNADLGIYGESYSHD
ncbi:Adenosine monophosphate-protein transferase FICD [Termitomyces sp. J132]|nr:Adenosine monophosphate-protein transferase FICD [Termitomyces sp. J132]